MLILIKNTEKIQQREAFQRGANIWMNPKDELWFANSSGKACSLFCIVRCEMLIKPISLAKKYKNVNMDPLKEGYLNFCILCQSSQLPKVRLALASPHSNWHEACNRKLMRTYVCFLCKSCLGVGRVVLKRPL